MCCFSDFLLWFAISQIFPHSPPIGEDCKGKHKKWGIKTYSPFYLAKNTYRLIGPWYLSGYVQGGQIQDLGPGDGEGLFGAAFDGTAVRQFESEEGACLVGGRRQDSVKRFGRRGQLQGGLAGPGDRELGSFEDRLVERGNIGVFVYQEIADDLFLLGARVDVDGFDGDVARNGELD